MRRIAMLIMCVMLTGASLTRVWAQGAGDPGMGVAAEEGNIVRVELMQIINASMQPFLAVAQQDATVCASSACKDWARELMLVRYIGEGRCELASPDFSQPLCIQVQSLQCETLTDPTQMAACKAILKDDVEGVPALLSALENPKMTVEEVAINMGIIEGYRARDIGACSKYIRKYVKPASPMAEACNIVFAGDPQSALQQAAGRFQQSMLSRYPAEITDCWIFDDQIWRQICFVLVGHLN
ncbi:MAG: hypothetical protein HGA80_03945 [Candidatus Omnitrophica bacterium]|nr:hypothetical protein [Candidatus Omnitrophota bacterium]